MHPYFYTTLIEIELYIFLKKRPCYQSALNQLFALLTVHFCHKIIHTIVVADHFSLDKIDYYNVYHGGPTRSHDGKMPVEFLSLKPVYRVTVLCEIRIS